MGCCGGKAKVTSRDDPILIGAPNNVLLRARVTISMDGLRPGDVGWFTGDGVEACVAGALLVVVL